MMTAAIAFFAIAVVTLGAFGVTYLFRSSVVDALKRAQRLMDELKIEASIRQRSNFVKRFEAETMPHVNEVLTPLLESIRNIGRTGQVSDDELQLIRHSSDEIEKWIILIRKVRSASDDCAQSSHELLQSTIRLFMEMAETVQDRDSEAAKNLSNRATFLISLREIVWTAPVAVPLVIASTLTRVEMLDGDDIAQLTMRVGGLMDKFRSDFRQDMAADKIPDLLVALSKSNRNLTKAVAKCDAIIRGTSRFGRMIPSLRKICTRNRALLDVFEKLSSELH